MARYLGLIKVSSDEASRMLRDGPSQRRAHLAHLVDDAGGTLEGAWLTNVGDWDLICLVDMGDQPAANGAAATLARRAAGLTNSERWIELAEIDDVDAAVGRLGGSPG